MKKVSKVFLIIGGIFAILFSLYFAYGVVASLMGGIGYGVGSIIYIIYGIIQATASEGDGGGMISGFMGTGGAMFIVGFMIAVIGSITMGTYFILTLLSGIFALVSLKRKKGLSIASLIITGLSVVASLAVTPAALYLAYAMVLLFWLFVFLLITPITWLYLGFIILVIVGWLAIVFIILGNIFSLISIAKDKNDEEVAEFGPEVEVVE